MTGERWARIRILTLRRGSETEAAQTHPDHSVNVPNVAPYWNIVELDPPKAWLLKAIARKKVVRSTMKRYSVSRSPDHEKVIRSRSEGLPYYVHALY